MIELISIENNTIINSKNQKIDTLVLKIVRTKFLPNFVILHL